MRIHILLFFLLFETFCKAQLPNYIPILVGDKYGFCDSNMNMLIEPQYKSIEPAYQNYLVKENKRYFLLNANTGQKTPYFDNLIDINTFTKYINYHDHLTLYFSYTKNLTSFYWFKNTDGYIAASTKDTLYIFNSNLDVIVKSSTIYQKNATQKVLLLDSITPTFFYSQNRKEKPIHIKLLGVEGTIKEYLIDKKDTTNIYPIGANYLSECVNGQCALLKVNNQKVDTLTTHNYFLLELDTITTTIKGVLNTDLSTDSLGEIVFNAIQYLDTNGKNFYTINYNYPTQEHYRAQLQKRYHNVSILFYSPILDNKLIVVQTGMGRFYNASIYLKDSFSSPANLNTLFVKPYLNIENKVGINYLVKKTIWDSVLRNYTYLYGLINNVGTYLMPLKYSKIEIVTNSLLIYRDSTHTGIANSSGKILFNTEIKTDTFTHISPQKHDFFGLYYTTPKKNARYYDTSVCFLLKNETYTELTKYQIDSIYIANQFRTYEPNTLSKLGKDSVECYYSGSSKRPPYYKIKCKLIDSNQKTIFRNITTLFTRTDYYNNLFFIKKGSNKKTKYIFYNRKGIIFYKPK